MKIWDYIFRTLLLIIGISVLFFNVLLYNFYEKQKVELDSVKDKLDVESEFNTSKFKYQADQIERNSKAIEDARQQVSAQKDVLDVANNAILAQKDALNAQKDALLQEVDKRQQLEGQSKGIQTALIDIKAESDAIKQDMKGWQKDYVSVLAVLEKKMDDSQYETKVLEDNLTALKIPELKEEINSLNESIEKTSHPADNSLPAAVPVPEKKIDGTDAQFQQQ